jgi:uncharacterized Tic20 family protein
MKKASIMISQNDKNIAFLTHLSGFGGYIIPFGSIIIPLIIWETKKKESQFIDDNGKEALNFNLSYLLYTFLLGITVVPFFVGSFFSHFREVTHFDNMDFHLDFDSNHLFGIISIASLISVLAIAKIVLIIMASINSHKGEKFKYPLTINFVK